MLFKTICIVLVLSCLTTIDAISMDQFIRLTQGNANVDEISKLSEILRGNRGDMKSRQAATPAAAPDATPAAAPAATPATTAAASTSSLSPLISGIISAFGTVFSPFLGPFKPLADAAGPLLNSAFTGIISNALSGLVGVLKSNDLPNSGYDTYLVNVPNQGSYIIMAKSPEKQNINSSPVPVESQSQAIRAPLLNELLSNAIRDSQLSQIDKTPLTAAALGADIVKKKPLLIPLSLLATLAGVSLPKNQKSYSDYEIILDEN